MYSIFPVSAKPKENENNQNRVSAYLYEATKNQTYRDAASSSQRFIQTQLMDTLLILNIIMVILDVLSVAEGGVSDHLSLLWSNYNVQIVSECVTICYS